MKKLIKKENKEKKVKPKSKGIGREKIFKVLLFVWLVLLLVGNGLTAIAQLVLNGVITGMFIGVPSKTFYIMGVFAVFNFLAISLMLIKRKVGFYSYAVLALIIFFYNLSNDVSIGIGLAGFAPLVVLALLMVPNWKRYK